MVTLVAVVRYLYAFCISAIRIIAFEKFSDPIYKCHKIMFLLS